MQTISSPNLKGIWAPVLSPMTSELSLDRTRFLFHLNWLFDQGIDVLTLGNHCWDQKEMLSYIEECPKIIRALNYPYGVPGQGEYKIE